MAARETLSGVLIVAGCTRLDPSYLDTEGASVTGPGPTVGVAASSTSVAESEPGTTGDESLVTSSGDAEQTSGGVLAESGEPSRTSSGEGTSTSGGADGSTTGQSEGDSTGDAAGCGDGSIAAGDFCFAPGQTLLAVEALDVAVSDFNQDEALDLLVGSSGALHVSFGGGNGLFPAALDLGPGSGNCIAVAAGDVNGDSIPDALALRGGGGDPVLVFTAFGDESFAPAWEIETPGGEVRDLGVAPMNGDARADAVSTQGGGGGTVAFYAGNADGTLADPVVAPAGAEPEAIVIAALDDDPALDLAIALRSGDAVVLALGNGDGTFGSASFPVAGAAEDIAAGDVDGDGVLDLVAVLPSEDAVQVLVNDGAGVLTVLEPIPVGGDEPTAAIVADLDMDGNVDLVVATRADDALWVHFGLGDGTFADPQQVIAAPDLIEPSCLAGGDFNEDGVVDLAVGGDHGVAIVVSDP